MTKLLASYSRSKRISAEKRISALLAVLKIFFLTLITIYIQGVLWYRFSIKWQYYFSREPESSSFIFRFGMVDSLSLEGAEEDLEEAKNPLITWQIIVKLMYFFLTTLSTVGYGDFFPSTIGEKIVGIFVEIVGVSMFSVLMNLFIQEVFKLRHKGTAGNESKLTEWFHEIRTLRNMPHKGSKDISFELKKDIETHFKYLWLNDRSSVLFEENRYFDAVPVKL